MYIRRKLHPRVILEISFKPLFVLLIWSSLAVAVHLFLERKGYTLVLPLEVIELLGISVAFYLGFKNNQAYNRFWEGRIIWGGIVNYSRSWSNGVLSFLQAEPGQEKTQQEEARTLVHRHIAWLYALDCHLRRPSHSSPDHSPRTSTLARERPQDGQWEEVLKPFLSKQEYEELLGYTNKPAQLVRFQGRHLKRLRFENGWLDSYNHAELTRILEEFYNLQGKCERIKNTPFPRQFGHLSESMVKVFCFLLPLGLLGPLRGPGLVEAFLTIPTSMLIGWSFLMSEQVGDRSEDPFENFIYDVPMSTLSRSIEIDLREMVGDPYIPAPLKPENHVLW